MVASSRRSVPTRVGPCAGLPASPSSSTPLFDLDQGFAKYAARLRSRGGWTQPAALFYREKHNILCREGGVCMQSAGSLPAAAPATVVKRSGREAPFELAKIAWAIARAGAASGEFDAAAAGTLADQVDGVLATRFADRAPHIEQIQDAVELCCCARGILRPRAPISSTASSTRGCARTARRWSTSQPRSTNT